MIGFRCSICGDLVCPDQIALTWRGFIAHQVCKNYDDLADAMEMEAIRKAEIRNESMLYGYDIFLG